MSEQRIQVALLSHTNAGKTTLARTLLRQDIGAVMDRAHVTETAESHVLLRTEGGDEFVLWDTPGFGDSVRLLRRLEQSGQPIGWFLSQLWDRFAEEVVPWIGLPQLQGQLQSVCPELPPERNEFGVSRFNSANIDAAESAGNDAAGWTSEEADGLWFDRMKAVALDCIEESVRASRA